MPIPMALIANRCLILIPSFTYAPSSKSKEKSTGIASIIITSELSFEAYSPSTGKILS